MRDWLSRCALAASIAACCGALPSCISYDVTSPSDYIGPTRQAASRAVEAPAPATGPTSRPVVSTGPLEITVPQAILMALENNEALIVQGFNPQIRRTSEQEARAVFDPDLGASFSGRRTKTQTHGSAASVSKSGSAEIALGEFLPTGTTVVLSLGSDVEVDEPNDWTSHAGLTVTQALLRGFGPAVNLASLRQARLDVLTSQYELRGFAETLVADTEKAYWDYVLAQRQIEIVEQSLALAEDQLGDTKERIRVGKLAELERAAAEAEVALRREDLINARSALQKARLQLLRLLNAPGEGLFDRQIVPRDLPVVTVLDLGPVEEHVQVANRMRADLNEARLRVNRGELEIVKTRNGLLPKMDLFVALGRTGYAESFGPSLNDIAEGRSYDAAVGLSMEYPPLNRAAQARHIRATISRDQSMEAVNNVAQLAEVDVRSAYIEVIRSNQQVAATAATRKLQEEKLRAETEKFRVGKSTTLLVATAQRDLLVSQIDEVRAVASHLKSLVDLYRLEGSLLERRGIASPGREQVVITKNPRP
jgi:outer membrane protein TolC